jgi:hypothetical protein
MMYELLEMFADRLYVLSDFFYVKVCSVLLLGVASIKLDQVWVIKVANFLKAGLKNVPFDIFIDFAKSLEFLNNFKTNTVGTELSKLLCEQRPVNSAESWDKHFLHEHYLGVADFIVNLSDEFLLYRLREARVALGKF